MDHKIKYININQSLCNIISNCKCNNCYSPILNPKKIKYCEINRKYNKDCKANNRLDIKLIDTLNNNKYENVIIKNNLNVLNGLDFSKLLYIKNLSIYNLTSSNNLNYLNNSLNTLRCFDNISFAPLDYLPLQLKILYIFDIFNKNLDKLPILIKCLNLGISFKQKVDNLPIYIYSLYLGIKSYFHDINNLPNSLTFASIYTTSTNITKLPESLKHIVLYDDMYITGNTLKNIKHIQIKQYKN